MNALSCPMVPEPVRVLKARRESHDVVTLTLDPGAQGAPLPAGAVQHALCLRRRRGADLDERRAREIRQDRPHHQGRRRREQGTLPPQAWWRAGHAWPLRKAVAGRRGKRLRPRHRCGWSGTGSATTGLVPRARAARGLRAHLSPRGCTNPGGPAFRPRDPTMAEARRPERTRDGRPCLYRMEGTCRRRASAPIGGPGARKRGGLRLWTRGDDALYRAGAWSPGAARPPRLPLHGAEHEVRGGLLRSLPVRTELHLQGWSGPPLRPHPVSILAAEERL